MDDAEDVNGGQSLRRLTSSAMSGGVKIKEMVDEEEVEKLSAQKKSQVILDADEPRWRQSIRDQMETELERRVREALSTPPQERLERQRQQAARQRLRQPIDEMNAHFYLDLAYRDQNSTRAQRWKALQAQKDIMSYFPSQAGPVEFIFRDELCKSNQDEFPGVFGLDSFSEGIKNIREDYTNVIDRYAGNKPKARHFYTKEGFLKAIKTGSLPAGVQVLGETGQYVDKYGVMRNSDGPFWPLECVPLFPTPRFKWWGDMASELLYFHLPESSRTVDNQVTPYNGRWRGVIVIYDLERSPRDYSPQPVSDGCCPSLLFESRFESGNLRQARRIGQFEYELVLKTDLYTARHTQWYFFRVHNAQPNVTYKFKIVNLLKSSSLYNFGMRPLMYSENDAAEKKIGWVRVGHHINYTRNTANNSCPLLLRSFTYYMLEWQMEFPNADDTYYLAHCYPYTFTDLKDDLDVLMASPEHKACVKREVLCETRAGNSCFLLTVTNFENPGAKKAVIVSARVHPGESQSSWMMKGLLEFITGPDPVAQELRDKFVFKMVPMLNPDGVIVGNYRCSLAGRDLNRNYRHPRRENFPTIFHVKAMVEEVAQNHEILLYCDLHGHSRKHNVFMYGNNTSDDDVMGVGAAQAFVNERLFPWLLSAKCPDKFSFRSCKFQIRKCKESTGRVVMWRQMNIFNSFTLEATFSGTILNKENCRHFNIKDLMEIGRNLAQAVLDYHKVQENKVYHTEMVLDLTKSITQQVLETQGLIPSDMILPDFSVERARMEKEADVVQKDAEKWMGAMLELLHQPLPSLVPVTNALDDRGRGRDDKSRKMAPPSKLTKEEASKLLDQASLGTVDGCLKILSALNVREALQESDSSDSDSESEPEMKPSEAKTRKKKRKSRKQRDKDLYDKKQADVDKRGDYTEKEKYVRGKSFSALPALLCAEAPPTCPSGHTLSGNSLSDSFLTSAQMAKKQAGSSSVLERLNRERRTSQFQSKYEGRHNGGVPCFTEERSMERAAKRLAEMKKKCDEDKNRDLAFYYVDDQGFSQFPPHMYPYVLKQDDFNHRLHVALSEGTSNLSRSLMSMNIRTSYTHADNLQDLHPSINGNSFHFLTQACNLHGNVQPGHNHLSQSSNSGPTVSGCNLHTSTANATMPVVGNNQDNSQNSCSEDSSDSTGDGLKMQSLMALSARRTPYYSDLVRRSSTLATWPVHASRVQNNHSVTPPGLVAKRIVRYKAGHVPGRSPPLRSFQPHSLSTAPTIITSTIQPISRDPLRNHDNHRQTPMVSQPAVDEREAHCERTHPGRGSLIHCLQTPNIRQGFIWE